jgi:CHAD domain-containing protein
VRDLDVQLVALRSFKMARHPRRKTQLITHLIELRGGQEKKLRKLLDKDTVSEIRKRLKRAEKNFKPQDSRDPLHVARAILAQIDGSGGSISEDTLHRYRILSKRARYAAEFAERSAEADRLIASIRRVQDALGDWHDWLTLTETAKVHLGEVQDSPLVAELHNVTGAKFRRALAALPPVSPETAPGHKHAAPASSRTPSMRSDGAASAA